MKNKETSAAVVVTFNRKNFLIESIKALINQSYNLDGIIIIDNASTDGTAELLIQNKFICDFSQDINKSTEVLNVYEGINIHYIRLQQNTGGAGGFHKGIETGKILGYDWLWLMDDDAEPQNDAFEKLMKVKEKTSAFVLVSAVYNKDLTLQKRPIYSVIDNDKYFKNIEHKESDFIENEILNIYTYPLLGVLINQKVIEACGNVKEEFFIQCDDLEYTLRISDKFSIVWVRDSILIHKEVESLILHRKVLGKNFYYINIKEQWKDYYGFRNHMLVAKIRNNNRLVLKRYLRDYIDRIIRIIIAQDNKLFRIKINTKAILDAVNNRTGKRVKPGLLPKKERS
ncbi:glycosyltransferase [Clostridium sp. SYSU_GA19001]|uniref:glycosyltransferase n=1 Tax=Clostridium caldaquaticum TaxID=2940653 RepID=UPI0020776DDE|nr:glycosyltransferase [Clostridium caldaquaticum]MCM8709410.1 glycosyltransferase [Clostridium caldaquaticum]